MTRTLISALLLVAITSWSQTVHQSQTATIAWDAPTTLVNGEPIPDTLVYDAYRLLLETDEAGAQTGGVLSTAPEFIATTAETQLTVACTQEGLYTLGVRARRDHGLGMDGDPASVIVWSNFAELDAPFVVRCVWAPEPPTGLRLLIEVSVRSHQDQSLLIE